MNKRTTRVVGFVGSVAATVGLLALAATGTGAYFSDTETGTIKGTVGSITVNADLDVDLGTVLPGDTVSSATTVTNTGNSPVDLWVSIPAVVRAQHALIDLNVNGTNVLTADYVNVGRLDVGGQATLPVVLSVDSSVDNDSHGALQGLNLSTGYKVVATQINVHPAS
ncbi:TasA family protein [Cellulomonas dongxiuzhuiae]|uniref:M73 family metallopeptidase n=1 Tax=Cellulomonas dongxiuzhuiae TaxID=2819979 RepID=A0ABX8GHP2_9CELL|nr:TasA family protein [Cellulomonas dongxiuzhuiae]MBO3094417.1 hypothetical protein [Cellulomonas dongxiuzhuiae]QWC15445.1 M73 family metallopeptidase [Cellulomonas dongxiuzhuiae]